MKTASSGLIALLGTGTFVFADCYRITPQGGLPTLYLTNADVDVTYGGHTYIGCGNKGPNIDGGEDGTKACYNASLGLNTASWTVAVMPRALDVFSGAAFPDKIGSTDFVVAVHGGFFDNAIVEVDRVYWPSWPQPWQSPLPAGEVLWRLFYGNVGDIDMGVSAVVFTVNSPSQMLQQSMPRHFWQAPCWHTLFDSGCRLTAIAYARAGSVSASASRGRFSSSVTTPSGFSTFALGRVVMASGKNAGLSRAVRAWDGTNFALIFPFPEDIAPGDNFLAYPGCDKTRATCFGAGNIQNFGGYPWIPAAETAA